MGKDILVHREATVSSCNLLKKLCLKSDVIPKTSKSLVGVCANVQHEQALSVDLLNAIRPPQAELEDTTALVGKLRNPLWHLRKSDCAAGLNHGERGKRPKVQMAPTKPAATNADMMM